MFKLFLALFFCLVSATSLAGEVKLESYEEATSKKDVKVLIIMGADWCGYCVKLKGDLKNLDLDGYVVTVVNVDERKDLKSKHGVTTLPTSIIFKNGEQLSKKVGYEKRSYKSWLKDNEDLYGYQNNCCLDCCKCENCKKQSCNCCKCK